MDARRHTLLVVDDEVDVLESLRHLFHRSYRVLTASSGDLALELLEKNDVHLILSDQRMPGMSGDVFLSHARRLKPDAIRILLVVTHVVGAGEKRIGPANSRFDLFCLVAPQQRADLRRRARLGRERG